MRSRISILVDFEFSLSYKLCQPIILLAHTYLFSSQGRQLPGEGPFLLVKNWHFKNLKSNTFMHLFFNTCFRLAGNCVCLHPQENTRAFRKTRAQMIFHVCVRRVAGGIVTSGDVSRHWEKQAWRQVHHVFRCQD